MYTMFQKKLDILEIFYIMIENKNIKSTSRCLAY
jgi:hypothetical protein